MYYDEMKLIIIRHGQTEGNKEGRLQGKRSDEPLSAEGVKEVEKILDELDRFRIKTLYSSTLKRAIQTADIIAGKFNVAVIAKSELAERDFGTLTGFTWEEIAARGHGNLKDVDKALSYNYRPFDGESVGDVRFRIKQFIKELFSVHKGQTTACVTHGGIIRIIYDILSVEQPAHIPNASSHIFEITEKIIE